MMRVQCWAATTFLVIVSLSLGMPAVGQTVADVVSFTGSNNLADPGTTPVQGRNGKLYGTITGIYNATSGSVFDFAPNGTTKVVYAFTGSTGNNPFGLTLGTDGNFYGVTSGGGSLNYGVLFKVTPNGTNTVLHNFTAGTDGMGLGPFISFVRPSGKVGQSAQILGQGLTGTTKVTFNGKPATSFSVADDTYMTAVIPSGATTGKVVVTTSTGKLTSNVRFRILK
jgi:uncharacterized repeat protein (TIGR03803 family)